jgi:hypothetical protein
MNKILRLVSKRNPTLGYKDCDIHTTFIVVLLQYPPARKQEKKILNIKI